MLGGFSISLVLDHETFSGMDAVDKCRELGLPNELASIYTSSDWMLFSVTDEAKIRTWFNHFSCFQKADVKVAWMASNELHQEGSRVCISKDIPEARIWDLYVRSEVEKLRKEIEQVNAMLVETRGELASALCAIAEKNDEE